MSYPYDPDHLDRTRELLYGLIPEFHKRRDRAAGAADEGRRQRNRRLSIIRTDRRASRRNQQRRQNEGLGSHAFSPFPRDFSRATPDITAKHD